MSEQVLMRFRLKADGKLYEMVGSEEAGGCESCVANEGYAFCYWQMPDCYSFSKPGVGLSKNFRRVEE